MGQPLPRVLDGEDGLYLRVGQGAVVDVDIVHLALEVGWAIVLKVVGGQQIVVDMNARLGICRPHGVGYDGHLGGDKMLAP